MNQETEDCGCGDSTPKTKNPTVMSRILDKVFVSEIEKATRMELCKTCEHFDPTFIQCGICGCFLEAKTRLKNFHCALDQIGQQPKW
jgi:hypothetical protein